MKKMNFYKCGRTALALGLAGTMLFTRPMHVSAVRSISEIEEEQSSIQSELNGLDSDMVALVTEMTTLESEISSRCGRNACRSTGCCGTTVCSHENPYPVYV